MRGWAISKHVILAKLRDVRVRLKSWTLYSVISEGRVGRGLEVASVVAGVLGVQGVLAGLIGLARGLQITAVNISALEAALSC